MKRARRVRRFIFLTPIVAIVLVVLWGYLDSTGGAEARTVWNYTWPGAGGGERGGFLVEPAVARRSVADPGEAFRAERSADGRYPAVLLIHEWWGLNLETARIAEQLAADGYVVLAPDLLRGRLAVTVPGALFQMVTVPKRAIEMDLDLAFQQLRGIPEVDPRRVAVVGFCFGGTQAMHFGARNDTAAAIGIFYGGGPITDADDIGYLGRAMPVFAAYGEHDRTISSEDVAAFRELLEAGSQAVTVTTYRGVGHAFVNPQSLRSDATAQTAWNDLRRFLRSHLSSS